MFLVRRGLCLSDLELRFQQIVFIDEQSFLVRALSMSTLSDDRLDALSKWAKRITKENSQRAISVEERRNVRMPLNAEIALIPITGPNLRPQPESRVTVVTRDFSESGIGILSNCELNSELYFAQAPELEGIFLIRKARDRQVRGSIREYGFMIIDMYESFKELRGQ